MIQVSNVEVVIEGDSILQDITLTLEERRIGIIGVNGSGKTTLARLLNGLTLPTKGTVTVDGLDTGADRRAVQRRVGFVFQNSDHQLVYPTPVDDVALGLRARGVPRAKAFQTARSALAQLGMEHKAEQAIHTLSGGEKHLSALCAILVLEPRWIVLDEPTTALDLVNRARVKAVLGSLSQRLIVVSHDLDLLRDFDRVIVLDSGTVIADGSAAESIETFLSHVGV